MYGDGDENVNRLGGVSPSWPEPEIVRLFRKLERHIPLSNSYVAMRTAGVSPR